MLLAATSCPAQRHFGTADALTLEADVEETATMVRREGKLVEIYRYDGSDHGFAIHTNSNYGADHAAMLEERAANFLRRHLR